MSIIQHWILTGLSFPTLNHPANYMLYHKRTVTFVLKS